MKDFQLTNQSKVVSRAKRIETRDMRAKHSPTIPSLRLLKQYLNVSFRIFGLTRNGYEKVDVINRRRKKW